MYWYGRQYEGKDEDSACKRVSFKYSNNCNKIMYTVFVDLIYGFNIGTVKGNIKGGLPTQNSILSPHT